MVGEHDQREVNVAMYFTCFCFLFVFFCVYFECIGKIMEWTIVIWESVEHNMCSRDEGTSFFFLTECSL